MAGPRSTLTSRPRGESYLTRLSPERRAIADAFAELPRDEQTLIIGLAKAAKEDLWVFLRKRWDGAALARQAFSGRPSPVSASVPGASPSPSSPQRFAYGVPEIRSADDLKRIADDYAAKENAKNKRGDGPRAVPIKSPDDLAAAAADYAARETAKAQSERSAR